MGMLIDGQWHEEDRTIQDGAYVRPTSPFAAPVPAELICALSAEPGRFSVIASLSCPWSHRILLVRAMKDLGALVPVFIAGGPRTQGYRIGTQARPWHVPGTDISIEHLHQLYALASPGLTARSTVPLLWDRLERVIVSNESARLLPALDAVRRAGAADWTLAPDALREDVEAVSEKIQSGLCNAVYRAGKARRQAAYEAAVADVFATLDMLEDRLGNARFVHGAAPTETDLKLWPSLARFDLVYHGHFKCSRRRLTDYANLWGYARDLYSWPGVAGTFDPSAIRSAYYSEDRDINPSGVVAVAPDLNWDAPHDRGRFGVRQVWTREGDRIPLDAVERARERTARVQT